MIGLIVTGHANFGSGMTSSVNLIAGEQEAYRYVDFLPTYGTEELTEEIAKAMDELKDCEGIIIFTAFRRRKSVDGNFFIICDPEFKTVAVLSS